MTSTTWMSCLDAPSLRAQQQRKNNIVILQYVVLLDSHEMHVLSGSMYLTHITKSVIHI